MMVAEIFAGRDQEAAGARRWIADDVRWRGLGQLDHQRDDVARGAKLTILAGSGDLAEHVFVDIALGVAIVHPDLVELLDGLGEQRRRRDAKTCILHMLAESRALATERAQKREDMFIDD